MKSFSKNNHNMIPLSEEHIYFGGMNLSYQLLLCKQADINSFHIRVVRETEIGEAEVGTDLSRALSWFQSIVRGVVTPCTLEDVIHDLQFV